MTWHDGPMMAYDCETTGVDVETDRIVTACLGMSKTPGEWQPERWLINPGVPIPDEAAAVHGITDQQAQTEGAEPAETVAAILGAIYAGWETNLPLVVYNAPFDLTILDREARRHLGEPFTICGPVVDPLICDKGIDRYRKGSRRLSDVAAHYGVTLTDAHTADADAHAALQIARTLPEIVSTTTGAPEKGHSLSELDLRQLWTWQARSHDQQQASFHDYLARKGDPIPDKPTAWPYLPAETKAA